MAAVTHKESDAICMDDIVGIDQAVELVEVLFLQSGIISFGGIQQLGLLLMLQHHLGAL